jgi:hypothetical protein
VEAKQPELCSGGVRRRLPPSVFAEGDLVDPDYHHQPPSAIWWIAFGEHQRWLEASFALQSLQALLAGYAIRLNI